MGDSFIKNKPDPLAIMVAENLLRFLENMRDNKLSLDDTIDGIKKTIEILKGTRDKNEFIG